MPSAEEATERQNMVRGAELNVHVAPLSALYIPWINLVVQNNYRTRV